MSGVQVPEVGKSYRLGAGARVYTVTQANENMVMVTWRTPGDIGIRNRYIGRADFARLVPVE